MYHSFSNENSGMAINATRVRASCEFSDETSRIVNCLNTNLFNGTLILVLGMVFSSLLLSLFFMLGAKMLSSKIDAQNEILKNLNDTLKIQQMHESVPSK